MRAELSSNSFYKRKIMKRRWEIRQNRRKMINSFLYGLKRELITPSKNNEIIQAIICGLITMFLMGIILVRAIGG
jgi:predicted nuclease of restriction endonuclease-like (RecB) superfamily